MLAVRDYCFRHYGVKLGDREARIWGASVPNLASQIKDWLLHRRSFCVTNKSSSYVIEELRKWQPDYIYGYSSSI
ncbi:MAG: CoF synthetase, partial [Marinobacter alexandrii]